LNSYRALAELMDESVADQLDAGKQINLRYQFLIRVCVCTVNVHATPINIRRGQYVK
jgi:hypothetical protein